MLPEKRPGPRPFSSQPTVILLIVRDGPARNRLGVKEWSNFARPAPDAHAPDRERPAFEYFTRLANLVVFRRGRRVSGERVAYETNRNKKSETRATVITIILSRNASDGFNTRTLDCPGASSTLSAEFRGSRAYKIHRVHS